MKKNFCFVKGFSIRHLDQYTDPHLYSKKAFMNVFSPPYSQSVASGKVHPQIWKGCSQKGNKNEHLATKRNELGLIFRLLFSWDTSSVLKLGRLSPPSNINEHFWHVLETASGSRNAEVIMTRICHSVY